MFCLFITIFSICVSRFLTYERRATKAFQSIKLELDPATNKTFPEMKITKVLSGILTTPSSIRPSTAKWLAYLLPDPAALSLNHGSGVFFLTKIHNVAVLIGRCLYSVQ